MSETHATSVEVGDFLQRNRDALVMKWETKIRARLPTDSKLTNDRRDQLRDSLPLFLDEVIGALKHGRGAPHEARRTSIARTHGAQRQVVNAHITDLVSEFYLLLESAAELVEETGGSGRTWVFELAKCLFSGATEAVEECARRQETEQRRSYFEHFASVAHDLGSPLAAARLTWDFVARKRELDPRSSDIITRSLDQLAELIDHSVTQLRITSGVETQRERVEIAELVADTRADSIVDADRKGIRIAVDVSQLVVEADRRLLRFALSNLLQNAINITRSGGEVAIRGRLSENRVLVEVEAECDGWLPDNAERPFTAFEKISRDPSGFRLGLASSKRAIEMHGGTLSLEGAPGKECIFTMALPSPTSTPKPSERADRADRAESFFPSKPL